MLRIPATLVAFALFAATPRAIGAAEPLHPDYLRLLLNHRVVSTFGRSDARLTEPKTDDAEAALRWQYLSLRDASGRIPPDALYIANIHRRNMPHGHGHRKGVSVMSITNTAWTSRGPTNVGGRTLALLINPTTTSTLYAGAAGGGIWKSTDSGSTWTPLDDFMKNLVVSSMVFSPSSSATIYAATGETLYAQIGDAFDGDAVEGLHGAGVFKSTDSGATWNQLSQTANWTAVSRITVHPSNGSILLAATTDGIYSTTDGGSTWTQVYSAVSGAETVLFDPANGNRVLASVLIRDQNNVLYHQVVYSTDAGQHWTNATMPVTTGNSNGRIEVAWARSTGTTTTAYADVAAVTGGNYGDLWKSTDGGQTFDYIRSGGTIVSQGVTDCRPSQCAIWVSPLDVNLVVTGGVQLVRTTNGGTSYTVVGDGYIQTADPHPDQHWIVEDPGYDGSTNKTVYVCNDGGIFKTTDIINATTAGPTGYNSGYWTSLNSTYQTSQFNAVAAHSADTFYTGGTQDNGSLATVVSSTPSSQTADWFFGGDGGWVAVDYFTPSWVYGEYTYLRLHRTQTAATQESAAYIYSGITDANANANFYAPFVMDPLTPTTILAGGQQLWRTATATATTPGWSSMRTAGSSNISAIAIWRYSSDIVWVAQNDGVVQMTTNGTASPPTWTTITTPVTGRYVTRIYIDPADSNTVYLLYGGYHNNNIYKSTNAGASWVSIAGSGSTALPAVPLRAMVRHPRDSRMLFVATDNGVYESDNGGSTWIVPTNESDGPADVAVDDLIFVEGSETLLAGTYGRGLFTYDLSSVPSYAPTGLTASATSTTSVGVSWNAYTGASSYQLYRSYGGSAYSQIGGTITTTSYTDSVTAGTTYLYKVKAVVSGVATDFSTPDLATTVTFTDDNALSGKYVSATYLTEVRNAVNDVLVAAGMSTQTWSGGTTGSSILATDITSLQTALVQAYRRIGIAAPTFNTITAGSTVIAASDTQQLRNAVK